MRLAVGLDGHRRNARIGDLEIVELTQAEAHLVGGAHRGPVRCYYVAFQTRIERTADAREPILLWGVERHVHVRSLFPVSREPAVGRLDEQPLIERGGSLDLEPARPLPRDLFHDRRVPDEVAVIGDTQGDCVSRAARRSETCSSSSGSTMNITSSQCSRLTWA